MTADDLAKLRTRVYVVVPAALAMGGVATWMLTSAMSEISVVIRCVFGLFFGGIVVFIVGTIVGSAFEREKVIQRGVVTGKRVGVMGMSNTNSRMSPKYYVSLDGEESLVESWVYQRIHTGQTVDLVYTARIRNLFDVAVISDPGGVDLGLGAVVPMAKPFDAARMAHDEPLTDADRGVLRAKIARALFWRGVGGGIVGFVVWIGVLLGWVFARRTGDFDAFDHLMFRWLAPAAGITVIALFNRHTWHLLRDLRSGIKRVADEIVRDVVHSNTPLLSSTTVVTGTGMAGHYAWVQTDARWVQIEPDRASSLKSGDALCVATALRSGIVLSAR